MQKNNITLGCALELLPTLANETVDIILTDPPYGDDSGYGRMDKTILGNDGPDINRQIIPDLYRILKKDCTAYIFTNWKFCHLIRQEMRLSFICIEKDPEYHAKSLERLELHRAQGTLF